MAGGSSGSAPTELKVAKKVVKINPPGPKRKSPAEDISSQKSDATDGRQEAIQKFQEYIDALKLHLRKALGEKLKDLHVPGGGVIHFEGFEVSVLANFVIASSDSKSAKGVKYQVELTCGEDYLAKPPPVVWRDCPVEHKMAGMQIGQDKVIKKDQGTKKMTSKGKNFFENHGN